MDWQTRLAQSTLTTRIILVTAACWLLVMALGLERWAYGFGGFIPLRFDEGFTIPGALPAILTPLSATLLHADAMHLAFNMLLMFICGRGVEQALGGRGLIALYVIGAYVAALGHFLFNTESAGPMIGASGAVSAIIGAYALLYSKPRNGVGGWRHVASLAAAWIVIQLLIGLTTYGSPAPVAIMAHIFGFGVGLAMARPLLMWHYRDA
ncbi:rhomboid family intramembrane serine protease [Parasphingopyxis algicola]|uniref:rhomboid family intramembrane serine protease n=1 Tax=Parasphingopyxis algicola TaxID=2026624 RepID=UPI00159F99BE|nr:rhomboid family intramembrane serine protease [Parasphingopyxis algicola]QLC24219.1 rhomboid family intramembrane serine protease [Parasphingopyxis algicola]